MATGTAGTSARQFHTAQVHYLRKKVTYLQQGTTVTVGTIPAYSSVIGGGIHVTTAFNGTGTADVGFIGGTTDADGYGVDLVVTAIGYIPVAALGAVSNIMQTVDTTVTVNVTSAAASAGEAYVTILYVPGYDT